jgi:predicted nucleotidyltransferase
VGELSDRRSNSKNRLAELHSSLKKTEALISGKASVYLTGSFGRGEAGKHSDLDLFIVAKDRLKGSRYLGSRLSALNEICVKSDLICAARSTKFEDFSKDGQYLNSFTVHDFTKTLGTPEDDVTNTFTGRLLLLLESAPLLEASVYQDAVQGVIGAYWRDFEGREQRFLPGFLCNDILRLWRTFCVNYEARTERQPDKQKAKGRLHNFKLRHSRLLTCFSGILYLLDLFGEKKTVSKEDAFAMTRMTPTSRLEWLRERQSKQRARQAIKQLLRQYEEFLSLTNFPEDDLLDRLLNDKTSKKYSGVARDFGDTVFRALTLIGDNNQLFRVLLV